MNREETSITMRYFMISLMLLAAVLTSCQPIAIPYGPWIKKVEAPEASRLVINFSAKAKQEHHIELEDSRMEYDDYIKKFYLEYSSQRLLNLYEARLMIVELVEEFLYRLNNHTVLGFELQHFPFTANDIEIKINFESYFGRYVDPLYIGLIWLKCGCVHFYAFDIKDQHGRIDWSHDRWEPYFKSRELAFLKKEADLPFSDSPSTRRPTTLIHERYIAPSR